MVASFGAEYNASTVVENFLQTVTLAGAASTIYGQTIQNRYEGIQALRLKTFSRQRSDGKR